MVKVKDEVPQFGDIMVNQVSSGGSDKVDDEDFEDEAQPLRDLKEVDIDYKISSLNSEKENCVNIDRYKSVDDILQDIGANGPFQWLLIATLLLIHIPGAIAVWVTYFITTDVQWNCISNSTSCTINGTLPVVNNGMCHLHHSQWVYATDIEISLKSFFSLHCGKEWLVHLATSSLFIGWAVSSLLGSFLADKYGRKNVLFTFIAVLLAAGLVSAFSHGVVMFIIFRFIMGMVMPSSFQIVFIMLGEFTNNKHRVMFMNILQCGQAVSLVLFSLVAYFVRDWRSLVLVTTLPFVLVLLTYKFVPESIYWLTLRGNQEDLVLVVKKICHWNGYPVPKEEQIPRVKEDLTRYGARMIDLFQCSSLIFQSLKVLSGAFVIGIVYYGLGLAADDLTGAFYRDFAIVRAVDIPSNILCIYLGNRFGRKKTVALNFLVASVACILIGFVPPNSDLKDLRLLLGMLGNFCANMAFNLYLVWTMELYGTDLRANAMGASNFMARMGGAVAPWIVKGLKHVNPNAPFFLEGSLGVLSAMLMWSLAETKNIPMRSVSTKQKPDVLLN